MELVFGGAGRRKEVPGRKKKGKEKMEEAGRGEMTLHNGHKEKNVLGQESALNFPRSSG